MNIKNKAFRPHGFDKLAAMQYRRKTGGSLAEFNWMSRSRYLRDCDVHRVHQIRVFSQIHYLASHAPVPVRAKYRKIEELYLKTRTPVNGSGRYADTYSMSRGR
jgi:hypothetical protein